MMAAFHRLKPKKRILPSRADYHSLVNLATNVGPPFDGGHLRNVTQCCTAAITGRPKTDCSPKIASRPDLFWTATTYILNPMFKVLLSGPTTLLVQSISRMSARSFRRPLGACSPGASCRHAGRPEQWCQPFPRCRPVLFKIGECDERERERNCDVRRDETRRSKCCNVGTLCRR